MDKNVSMGFEPESVSIAVRDILPLKQVPTSVKGTRKYRQIAAAIRAAGIAQPPVVARHPAFEGKYLLLEGHLRIEVLKELGTGTVTCLVSLDDEAFTYNRQVNRLATIQEHRMILKLVDRGIPEARIAETLDVNVNHVRAKRSLLNGICPEAAELLEDKHCPINTINTLKKMKPLRQVEAVELMISMGNYTIPYAKALLAATPADQRVDDAKRVAPKGVSPEQLAQGAHPRAYFPGKRAWPGLATPRHERVDIAEPVFPGARASRPHVGRGPRGCSSGQDARA